MVRLHYSHCWLNHDNSCADVIVAMTHNQRSVTEGGIVTVCASLTGQLGRNVEVRLATSSGGTGEGNTLINYKFLGMLLFSLIYPYSSFRYRLCISISDKNIQCY